MTHLKLVTGNPDAQPNATPRPLGVILVEPTLAQALDMTHVTDDRGHRFQRFGDTDDATLQRIAQQQRELYVRHGSTWNWRLFRCAQLVLQSRCVAAVYGERAR